MKRLRVVAGAAVSVALIVWLLRSVDLPELGRQLAATQWWWVTPAALVGPIGVWARARRWRYLFPPRSEPPGLVAANMIGYMANNILPLRAGELVRVYLAARHLRAERRMGAGESLWLVGATVVVERVLDSLSLVLIMAVLILVIPVPPAFQYAAGVILALDVVAAAVLIVLAIAPAPSRRVLVRLTRRWPALARPAEPWRSSIVRTGRLRRGRSSIVRTGRLRLGRSSIVRTGRLRRGRPPPGSSWWRPSRRACGRSWPAPCACRARAPRG